MFRTFNDYLIVFLFLFIFVILGVWVVTTRNDWTSTEINLKAYCDRNNGTYRHDGWNWDACLLKSGNLIDERSFVGFK